MQILAFLDTNMLVFPTRNFALGLLSNVRDFASQWNIGFIVSLLFLNKDILLNTKKND